MSKNPYFVCSKCKRLVYENELVPYETGIAGRYIWVCIECDEKLKKKEDEEKNAPKQ